MLEEYKKSLKMPEAEEILDLIFYRPLAYGLVIPLSRTPITPNQVTVLSLITGLITAYCFSTGMQSMLAWGAVWYLLSNVLDCADGQLARIQQSGTLFGRIWDGVADYISSIAIFLAIGFGLKAIGEPQWWLVIAGGFSSAIHAMKFDEVQSKFIAYSKGETDFAQKEMIKFSEEFERLKNTGGAPAKRLVIQLYMKYMKTQSGIGIEKARTANIEDYHSIHKNIIRFWSFLGPTTNRSLLVAAGFFGRLDYFLWFVFIAGNLWLMICIFLQNSVRKKS